MSNKTIPELKSVEIFSDYKRMITLFKDSNLFKGAEFIYDKGNLYLVKETNGDIVTLEIGEQAKKELVTSIKIVSAKGIDYVVLYYLYDRRVRIIYEDIEFTGSYYGDISKWFKTSLPFINDYFNNMIDEKLTNTIDNINIDSSTILNVVDKYTLTNSRDLLLSKAIAKYSNEMAALLEAIENTTLKKGFEGAIETIKSMITPKSKSVRKTRTK